MSSYRAAIDFGTTYTAAASQARSSAAPTVIALVDEGRLSSAVALDDSGRIQAGPYVEEVAALAPNRVERTPKRCLDQPDVMLGGEPVQTVDLAAAVLRYVRDELLRQFNDADPEQLCLTHPARWEAGDPRLERLEAAARQAGFPATKLLPEPCAAALALAAAGQLGAADAEELVAVYDLGGGTFDVALLSRAPGGDFILAGEPGGDPELGGEWLDDRLFERLSGQLPADDETSLRDPDRSSDPLRWRRAGFAFRQGIRRAKERLARETSIHIALTPPFSLDHLTLSRAELERTAIPLITKSADRFELFLQRNGKTAADLAAICLVGGSSRLTVVNRILGQRFERPIATHGDPKSVTALGALCQPSAAAYTPMAAPIPERAKASVGTPSSPPSSPRTGPSKPSPHVPTPERTVVQDVEAVYDEALAAFWTDQFDRAIELLRHVLDLQPDHRSATVKLEQAEQQQQLISHYAQACASADADEWDRAVAEFTLVSDVNPGYREVAAKLGHARKQQQIANLRAEAGQLHRARQWAAVVRVGEQLQALAPDMADLDGLVSSAQAELTAAEEAEKLVMDYRAALRLLDSGAWQQAADALEQIVRANPGYRDAEALLARARSHAHESGQQSENREPKVVVTVRHTVGVLSTVAFSLDGQWLASGGTDAPVQIWKITAAPPTAVNHVALAAWASAVMFSPDGSWLASCGQRTAEIWDTMTGQKRLSIVHKSSQAHVAAALSPHGKWLATGGPRNNARIWDTGTGKEVMTFSQRESGGVLMAPHRVEGLAFSPDGRSLAIASTDRTARIWDTATGQVRLTITHNTAVSAVTFSADGRWLATASADRDARIWDAATGKLLLAIGHAKAITAATFSPDGRWLATASADKAARIWNAADGQVLATLKHQREVRAVAFSPSGDWLATASGEQAQIWAL
jgi:TolA-binding protein